MNISNNGNIAVDRSMMMEKMEQKFKSADADNNGTLSKTEFGDNAPKGANQEKIDKMFERLDGDKDGEISAEEQQAMIEHVTERMERFAGAMASGAMASGGMGSGGMSPGGRSDDFDSVNSLLEALKDSAEDENSAATNSKELSMSLKQFIEKYPRIDETA